MGLLAAKSSAAFNKFIELGVRGGPPNVGGWHLGLPEGLVRAEETLTQIQATCNQSRHHLGFARATSPGVDLAPADGKNNF